MDKTKIEWADSTWNPITGCRHKCPYCYARGIANRFVSRKGCHLVEPETYKLGDDGSETYEINEQPYYVDDETGKQFRCAYPHGFVPTIHRYRMGEYRDKRGREISLSVQCRMCLESGFLIDGSGKCLMLVRKLHSIITSSSRRIPEDIWSCIITENYHSEIICGTERQSQIQIRSIWGRTDIMSSIRFCQ